MSSTATRIAVALVAASGLLFSGGVASADPVEEQSGGGATHGPCAYTKTPDEPPARPVGLPRDPRHTPDRGKVDVLLKTNHGPIPTTLDRAKAPCTVQSSLHLTERKFYDLTTCHRLTAYPTLKVLQCGDPSGTGEGGPGYKYSDELPTDLKPAPNDPTGERRIYPRGTLAMANAGPATNGSQFFLVIADSVLRPNYTVFGTVDQSGLATLDKIAAGGITSDDPNAPVPPLDGKPTLPVNISKAKVTCW